MTINFSDYSLEEILSLPFEQENGMKRLAAILGLLLLGFIIPLVPSFFVAGYLAVIIRRIVNEDGKFHLPSWDDIGGYFTLGLKINGAAALYILPALFFIILGYLLILFPMLSSMSSPESYAQMNENEIMAEIFSQMGLSFGGMAIIGIGFIIMLPISFILPVAITHMIAEDSFSAAFKIKDWWRILSANWAGFFISFVIVSGLYFVSIFLAQLFYLTLVLCILVPIILSATLAYISVVASAVIAIAYKNGVEKLEENFENDGEV